MNGEWGMGNADLNAGGPDTRHETPII
jgi:hypothetical protein